MGGKKEYIAGITFGVSTDTGDSYGTVISKSDKPAPRRKKSRQRFRGLRAW